MLQSRALHWDWDPMGPAQRRFFGSGKLSSRPERHFFMTRGGRHEHLRRKVVFYYLSYHFVWEIGKLANWCPLQLLQAPLFAEKVLHGAQKLCEKGKGMGDGLPLRLPNDHDFWSSVTVLADHGKSVDCRVPHKQSWTEKGQSHQVPNSGKKEKKERKNEQRKNVCNYVLSV